MKAKKQKGIDSIKQTYGRIFVLPWEIGILIFFIVPLITSIMYSLSEVNITSSGITTKFVGLKFYKYLILQDTNYLNNLRDAVGSLAYSLPIIVAMSLILAVVLNQKFHGRLLARAIFFLPVIIATGVVMQLMSSDTVGARLFTVTSDSASTAAYGSMIDFEAILNQIKLPSELTKIISTYIGNVFNLIWSCGIQTVLFIAGLQTIPPQLYEVSKVEGANKWEEFWYITVPMLGQVLLLVIVFTMIELFTSLTNPVMKQAYTVLQKQQVYDRSSAMLWGYFIVVGVIMSIVFAVYRKVCLKRWE